VCASRGGVDVRVVEHDDGVLAAQLRRHALELAPGDLADVRTSLARSGE
jgi:hypothetical protein